MSVGAKEIVSSLLQEKGRPRGTLVVSELPVVLHRLLYKEKSFVWAQVSSLLKDNSRGGAGATVYKRADYLDKVRRILLHFAMCKGTQ